MPIDPVLPRNLDDLYGPGAEQAEMETGEPETIFPWGPVRIKAILEVIKGETRPVEGHTDPGAIEDCWKEVFEFMEECSNVINKSVDQLAHAYPLPASKALKISSELVQLLEEHP